MTDQQKPHKERTSLSQYYNGSQFRIDTWNKLKNIVQRLNNDGGRSGDVEQIEKILQQLLPVEVFWAFPGKHIFPVLHKHLERKSYHDLYIIVNNIVKALMGSLYRQRHIDLFLEVEQDEGDDEKSDSTINDSRRRRPYFEVLFVDDINPQKQLRQRNSLIKMRNNDDAFTYEPVFVPSFEDALIAILFNYNIQAVVIRFDFQLESEYLFPILEKYLNQTNIENFEKIEGHNYGQYLLETIAGLRPELDLFLVTNQSVENIAGQISDSCERIFYNQEDFMELHLNILRAIGNRYQSPFFTALCEYSKQPTGVFHALPISRGKSIQKSHWIKDMGEFYGMNIFLAETSATSGGLDSLLEPHGPIKRAQELAASAFGARKTYFATNGTSTCNKIVVQALVQPGDIVLVDRSCHKSHHYGMVLTGADVIYLDSYPLHEYSMYGAVPLRNIKETLLNLRAEGKLDRVKMLLLTNCTFDGIVYNVERFMEECLAIKPDLVFLWDEAWFAFARFDPTYRTRTAMHVADSLRNKYRSADYKELYKSKSKKINKIDPKDHKKLLDTHLYPDPEKVRIRVYSTQSTHKTLTSLRQGSMIHVYDQDFNSKVEEPFHEAFMTHTSTSPNYQILASLDVGRRQVELEGFELVQKQIEMAMVLRQQIISHPLLNEYFKVLTVSDMIPAKHRQSGIKKYFDPEAGWQDIWKAWEDDEFCLDATRVTLSVGKSGLDGEHFKNEILMDRFGIQINKTSRNTVLFMTNIGTTRSSIAYLIGVLVRIAKDLKNRDEDRNTTERLVHEKNIVSLTQDLPPLPDFSRFHDVFRPEGHTLTPEGTIRKAYFLAYSENNCEYLSLDDGTLEKEMKGARDVVSTSFIIPYPPGFPILVPGQVISKQIIEFLKKLDVTEIHGYRPELGMRVFKESVLQELKLK